MVRHEVDVFREPDADVYPWLWACVTCAESGDYELESEAATAADDHVWERGGRL